MPSRFGRASPADDETGRLLNDIEDFAEYGTTTTASTTFGAAPPTADPLIPPPPLEAPRDETSAARLTRRLRCLFSGITWPIVPLGTLVSICLIWVLYSAFVLDVKAACSHPLHGYALASLIFLVYAPYHAQVRSHLFRYSRERDGPIRPTRVRLYDQFFHTLCILYVYGGVTILQNCKQDIGNNRDSTFAEDLKNQQDTITIAGGNSCELTCPHLYSSLDVYVTMLELFTLSLIIPLLFLPCIYLWFIRRSNSNEDSFWQEGLEDEDFFIRAGGRRISAQEIMASLEVISLRRNQQGNLKVTSVRNGGAGESSDTTEAQQPVVKECCICMNEFVVDDEESPPGGDIVRTKCGHVFHIACLGGWVGGRWDPGGNSTEGRRRARRTCCPLCRQDLKPAVEQGSTNDLQMSV